MLLNASLHCFFDAELCFVCGVGNLIDIRLSFVLLSEISFELVDAVNLGELSRGDADCSALRGYGIVYGVLHPPCGKGCEAYAS